MEIKDEEINKILKKAEDYRKDLSKSYSSDTANVLNNIDFGEIFEKFFKESDDLKEEEIKDKNNVYLNCKISKEEALKGTLKDIKYKQINEKGEKITNKIKVKIPNNIQDRQSIILRNCGNYIKEQEKWSHLIIEIKFK